MSFLDLHGARGAAGFGPAPITFADMAAYQTMHLVTFTPWEVSMLSALDRVALAAAAEQAREREARKEPQA